MRTTHERLTRHFSEQRDLPVSGSGVEAVMEQGRRQNRNRTIAVVAGCLALVGVLAVGASALQRYLEDDGRTPQVADGAGESEDAAAGELAWSAIETGIGYSSASVAGDGTLYILSTAPGVIGDGNDGPTQQALYTSTDGETWDVAVLGGELWVNSLTERDGTLYAIGTTPGTSSPFDAAVGVRDESDGTWEVTPLPSDFTGIAGLADASASRFVSIAGDDTVVAAVSTTAWGDFTPLLPDGVITETRGVDLTPEGVVVIDYELFEQAMAECGAGVMREQAVAGPGDTTTVVVAGTQAPPATTAAPGADDWCAAGMQDPSRHQPSVVFSATWEELGLEANPSLVEIYVSEDGGAFEKVETDLPAGSMVSLFSAGDGFVALANAYPDQSAWYSDDGRSWTRLQGLPGMNATVAAGTVGGKIVVVGSTSGFGPVVAAYDGAGDADPDIIDVASLVGGFTEEVYVPAGAVDDGTAVLAVAEFDMDRGRDRVTLITSSDLEEWTATPVSDMVGDLQTQAGQVMISDDGIYAQIIGHDVRPNQPWRPIPLMAIAERG